VASEGRDPRRSVGSSEGSHRQGASRGEEGSQSPINAEVERLTSIIEYFTKFGCLRREELVDKAEDR